MQHKAINNIYKRKPKHVNERNMTYAHLSLFPTLTALLIKIVIHQTKVDIEAKTIAHAETFVVESSCDLPTPPLEVKIIRGLYVYCLKQMVSWIEQFWKILMWQCFFWWRWKWMTYWGVHLCPHSGDGTYFHQ